MKIKINEGFLGLKDNYLFSEVARRVRDYVSVHPEEAKRLIRLGIGDVTLPLAPCVVAAARRANLMDCAVCTIFFVPMCGTAA